MPEGYQERQIAMKLRIKEINEGDYIMEEGWKPNYLLTKEGKKVSRVNLMGVILDKEEKGIMTNLILDDGSGKITARSFEGIKNLKDITTGEGVLVVGNVRIFNNEKYISPEIIKKIDNAWLKVRYLELEKEKKEDKETGGTVEEIEGEGEFLDSAGKEILDLIQKLDKGEGALIEEVKEKVKEKSMMKLREAEELIEKMLKNGEIFQSSSGKVKVL